MAAVEIGKVLAQVGPSASTLQNAYTCPADTLTTITSIFVVNKNTSGLVRFRIAHAPLGVADSISHYVFWDEPLFNRRTFPFTGTGIMMQATDILRVEVDTLNVGFVFYGIERPA